MDENVLTQDDRDGSDLVATIYLTFVETLDNSLVYIPGPRVTISKSAPSYGVLPDSEPATRRKTVAIAVPVILVVVLLALGAVVLWRRTQNKRGSGMFTTRRRRGIQRTSSGSNYGWPEDKSHSFELADRKSWGLAQGQNVFREEIQRQDAIRTSRVGS